MSRVFISYSHETDMSGKMRQLARELRAGGVVVATDESIDHGMRWSDWMEYQVEHADYVLVICTQSYRDRLQHPAASGVQWEGGMIRQQLYGEGRYNQKFIPVLLSASDVPFIPAAFVGFQYYDLSKQSHRETLSQRIGARWTGPRELRPIVHITESSLTHPDGHEVPFLAPPINVYTINCRTMLLQQTRELLLTGCSVEIQGSPGSGKTATAIQLAHHPELLEEYRDGVLWATLGQEQRTDLLLAEWASALGIMPVPRKTNSINVQPSALENKNGGLAAALELDQRAIGNALNLKRILFIIDNVATDEALSPFLELVNKSPRSVLLITRRVDDPFTRNIKSLIPADKVNGLEVRTICPISHDDGVVFLKRVAWPSVAEANVKDPSIAGELVEAVGGLPLGLRLIGNYIRVRSFDGSNEIGRLALGRLKELSCSVARNSKPASRSVPHATAKKKRPTSRRNVESAAWKISTIPSSLCGVIRLCYDAVGEDGQRALRALCFFPPRPNSFSEGSARAIAAPLGDTLLSDEVLQLLVDYGLVETVSLLDEKSPASIDGAMNATRVIPANQRRYAIHQTIREVVAALTLPNKLEHGVWQNVRRYYQDFARLEASNYSHLRFEIRNLLAVLRGAVESGDTKCLLRMLSALARFLENENLYLLPEIGRHLIKACENATPGSEEHVEVLVQLARRAEKLGNYAIADEYLRKCLPIAQKRRKLNPSSLCDVLLTFGIVKFNLSDYEDSENYLHQGSHLAASNFDRERMCRFKERLCLVWMATGNLEKAKHEADDARLLPEDKQIAGAIGLTLIQLVRGRIRLIHQQYEDAAAHAEEGLALASAEGIGPEVRAALLQVRARAMMRDEASASRASEAIVQLDRALGLVKHIGHRWYISFLEYERGKVFLLQEDLSRAETSFEEALLLANSLGSKDLQSYALWGLARVAEKRFAPNRAIRLAKQSLCILENIHHAKQKDVRSFIVKLLSDQAAQCFQDGQLAEAQQIYEDAGPICAEGGEDLEKMSEGIRSGLEKVKIVVESRVERAKVEQARKMKSLDSISPKEAHFVDSAL